MLKYAPVRSGMLEADEDAVDGGFGDTIMLYKPDVNDPALSNVSQTHSVFELMFSLNQNSGRQQSLNFRLAKGILNNDSLPNECLGVAPLDLVKKITEESKSSWE